MEVFYRALGILQVIEEPLNPKDLTNVVALPGLMANTASPH